MKIYFWAGQRAARQEAAHLLEEHGPSAIGLVKSAHQRARNRDHKDVARYWGAVFSQIKRAYAASLQTSTQK